MIYKSYMSHLEIKILARQLLVSLAVLAVIGLSGKSYSQDGYDNKPDTGLRMARYGVPIPIDIPEGITLANKTASALHLQGNRPFNSVYLPKGLGPDPLNNHWVTNGKRPSIPKAAWLPEVEQDTLSPEDSNGWVEAGNELQPVQPVNLLNDGTPSGTAFPDTAQIILIDQQGGELPIGIVEFSNDSDLSASANVEITSNEFEDQFLSMRPFKCLTEASEWFCHLPYPYELARSVTAEDLTNLEYQLLFIWKSPKTFGIDAWNGVYYQLTMQDDGIIAGQLLQGDLNVLAEPPEPGSYPIDLSEFIDEGADSRLYPSLVIRP